MEEQKHRISNVQYAVPPVASTSLLPPGMALPPN